MAASDLESAPVHDQCCTLLGMQGDKGIRRITAQCFDDGGPLLVSRLRGSFDFPLSRAEKLQRVLLLYEAETNVAGSMMETQQCDLRALRAENASLRAALQQQSVCMEAEANISVAPPDREQPLSKLENETHQGLDSCCQHSACDSEDSNCGEVGVPSIESSERGRMLHPSLWGTPALWQQTVAASQSEPLASSFDAQAVQELQHSNVPVTRLCFGQEEHHKEYLLLAVASLDGCTVIYRCYRTEMETAMLAHSQPQETLEATRDCAPHDQSYVAVHARLIGHTRQLTTLFFNSAEDQLITASVDKSVRFWDVNSGEMLKVFVGGAPVTAAALLPFNSQIFVATTSNESIHVVHQRSGCHMQTIRLETSIGVLKFDALGRSLLAGTSTGAVRVFEVSDSGTLSSALEVQVGTGAITCICFISMTNENPSQVLVSVSDHRICLADCTYGHNWTIAHLLPKRNIQTSVAPVGCCFSHVGSCCFIAGSEENDIQAHDLTGQAPLQVQRLKHHEAAVCALTVNLQNTLLVSADVRGQIVFWRQFCFRKLSSKMGHVLAAGCDQ